MEVIDILDFVFRLVDLRSSIASESCGYVERVPSAVSVQHVDRLARHDGIHLALASR